MFETVVRKEPSLAAYAAQQFAAPLVPSIAVFIFPPILDLPYGGHLGGLAIALGAGFLLGRLVRKHLATAAEGGRWVWVIPSLLMSAGLLHDSIHFSIRYSLAEFFWPGPEGEAWLAFMLMTIPVFSSIGYSIGCFKTDR
jgi:hypothetical protein